MNNNQLKTSERQKLFLQMVEPIMEQISELHRDCSIPCLVLTDDDEVTMEFKLTDDAFELEGKYFKMIDYWVDYYEIDTENILMGK